VASWDQHILPTLLTKPGQELAQILGEDLPADALPSNDYSGPPRVIVPTVRTSLMAGELLKLKVIFLARSPARFASFFKRRLQPSCFRGCRSGHVSPGPGRICADPPERSFRKRAKKAAVYWRPMGSGRFAKARLTHVARGVYSAAFPPGGARGTGLEYYVEVVTSDGKALHFPATAPHMNQTLVVVPQAR